MFAYYVCTLASFALNILIVFEAQFLKSNFTGHSKFRYAHFLNLQCSKTSLFSKFWMKKCFDPLSFCYVIFFVFIWINFILSVAQIIDMCVKINILIFSLKIKMYVICHLLVKIKFLIKALDAQMVQSTKLDFSLLLTCWD